MKDFKGKIAFITGGSSGAGFGQAQILSEAGCKVVLAGMSQDHLDEAMAYFASKGAEAKAIKMDVASREDNIRAAEQIEEWYGCPPDLFLMTAGVNAFGPAEASTFEDFEWVVGVNYIGVINGFVTFVPRMIKAKNHGHIMVTASMAAFNGGPTVAPYSSSKAAALNLCMAYYEALKPYGIGVTCFCPGGMNTNIHASSRNRPEHLKNSGYFESAESIELNHQLGMRGLDIREVGEICKKAIEDEIVISLPMPEPEKVLTAMLQKTINYCTVEGCARNAAMVKKDDELTIQARKAGWTKANPDLDWIDDSKK